MYWVRIDNRLVHGQVIEAWLPYCGAQALIVVNDDLAKDSLRQEIMSLAIPQEVTITFVTVGQAAAAPVREDALILFATCADARKAFENGLAFESLNIGNLHYSPGKKQVCAHVALSADDESCLDFFSRHGVRLDFRCVPGDSTQPRSAR